MLGESVLLTEKEASRLLGVKPRELREECAAGRLEHIQIAGRRMFSRSGIEAFLAKNTIGPVSSALPALSNSRMPIQAELMSIDGMKTSTSNEGWSKIEKCLNTFWRRCKKDDRGAARLSDGKELKSLHPVARNLLWIEVKGTNSRLAFFTVSPPDFKYVFVGYSISDGNGRDFEGERVLEKARENISKFGRAGFQSNLYMVLVESLATGNRQGFRGTMINAQKQVCDIRLSTVPICNNSDGVTDIIVGVTVRPVTSVLQRPS